MRDHIAVAIACCAMAVMPIIGLYFMLADAEQGLGIFLDVHDLTPWVVVLMLVGLLLVAVHFFMSTRRCLLDPKAKLVSHIRGGLFGNKRLELQYADAAAIVSPALIRSVSGKDWRGFALFIGFPKGRMLLGRSKELSEVEKIAEEFASMTGLAWRSSQTVLTISVFDY